MLASEGRRVSMTSPEVQVIDRAASLSQRAYQSLRKAICDGAIVHGVFYSEKDLASRLGISRTPVREALIELAREGLVTIAPQRGFQLHRLSHVEQEEIFELRLAMDTFMVEKLARSTSPEDIKQLRRAIAEQRAAGDEQTRALLADEQFHLLFPRLLGLERTYGLISTLRGAMWLLGANAFRALQRNEEMLKEHAAIVDALEAHDADAAALAVRVHLCNTLEAVRKSWFASEEA
jgi:GntR family transcriptional regulator, rspAB operon transcriptional repressor